MRQGPLSRPEPLPLELPIGVLPTNPRIWKLRQVNLWPFYSIACLPGVHRNPEFLKLPRGPDRKKWLFTLVQERTAFDLRIREIPFGCRLSPATMLAVSVAPNF